MRTYVLTIASRVRIPIPSILSLYYIAQLQHTLPLVRIMRDYTQACTVSCQYPPMLAIHDDMSTYTRPIRCTPPCQRTATLSRVSANLDTLTCNPASQLHSTLPDPDRRTRTHTCHMHAHMPTAVHRDHATACDIRICLWHGSKMWQKILHMGATVLYHKLH